MTRDALRLAEEADVQATETTLMLTRSATKPMCTQTTQAEEEELEPPCQHLHRSLPGFYTVPRLLPTAGSGLLPRYGASRSGSAPLQPRGAEAKMPRQLEDRFFHSH